jgi:hypothetical protein
MTPPDDDDGGRLDGGDGAPLETGVGTAEDDEGPAADGDSDEGAALDTGGMTPPEDEEDAGREEHRSLPRARHSKRPRGSGWKPLTVVHWKPPMARGLRSEKVLRWTLPRVRRWNPLTVLHLIPPRGRHSIPATELRSTRALARRWRSPTELRSTRATVLRWKPQTGKSWIQKSGPDSTAQGSIRNRQDTRCTPIPP